MLAFAAFALVLVSSADPVALFNGKNLDGWREASRDKASLAGKTEAFGGRFKVIDGVLVIDPAVKATSTLRLKRPFPAISGLSSNSSPARNATTMCSSVVPSSIWFPVARKV